MKSSLLLQRQDPHGKPQGSWSECSRGGGRARAGAAIQQRVRAEDQTEAGGGLCLVPAEGEAPHPLPTRAAQGPGSSAGDVLSGLVTCKSP